MDFGFNTGVSGALAAIIKGAISVTVYIIFYIVNMFFTLILNVAHLGIVWLLKQINVNFAIDRSFFTNTTTQFGRILTAMRSTMVTIALAVMFLIVIWQLFKSFFSYMNLETDDAMKLAGRVIIFSFLIYYSQDIIKYIIDTLYTPISNMIFELIYEAEEIGIKKGMTLSRMLVLILQNMGQALNMDWETLWKLGSFAGLIQGAVLVYVDFNILTLLFKFAQKTISMLILILIAPIAFACGVSKNTRDMFEGWIKSFVGVLTTYSIYNLILVIIILFLYLQAGGEIVINSVPYRFVGNTSFMFGAGAILGLLALLDQAETIAKGLGFNTGGSVVNTSSGMGMAVAGVGNVMMVGRTINQGRQGITRYIKTTNAKRDIETMKKLEGKQDEKNKKKYEQAKARHDKRQKEIETKKRDMEKKKKELKEKQANYKNQKANQKGTAKGLVKDLLGINDVKSIRLSKDAKDIRKMQASLARKQRRIAGAEIPSKNVKEDMKKELKDTNKNLEELAQKKGDSVEKLAKLEEDKTKLKGAIDGEIDHNKNYQDLANKTKEIDQNKDKQEQLNIEKGDILKKKKEIENKEKQLEAKKGTMPAEVYKEEKDKLKAKKEENKQELAKVDEKLKQSKEKLKALEADKKELDNKFKLSHNITEIDKNKKEQEVLNAKKGDILEKNKEIEAKEKQLEANKGTMPENDYKQKKAELRGEKETNNKALAKVEEQLNKSKERLNALEADKKELEKKCKIGDKTVEQIRKEVQEIDGKIKQEQAKIEDIEKNINSSVKRSNDLKKMVEISDMYTKISENNQKIEELKSKPNLTKEEQAKLEDYTKKNSELETKINESKEQYIKEKEHTNSKTKQREIKEFNSKMESLEKEYRESVKQVENAKETQTISSDNKQGENIPGTNRQVTEGGNILKTRELSKSEIEELTKNGSYGVQGPSGNEVQEDKEKRTNLRRSSSTSSIEGKANQEVKAPSAGVSEARAEIKQDNSTNGTNLRRSSSASSIEGKGKEDSGTTMSQQQAKETSSKVTPQSNLNNTTYTNAMSEKDANNINNRGTTSTNTRTDNIVKDAKLNNANVQSGLNSNVSSSTSTNYVNAGYKTERIQSNKPDEQVLNTRANETISSGKQPQDNIGGLNHNKVNIKEMPSSSSTSGNKVMELENQANEVVPNTKKDISSDKKNRNSSEIEQKENDEAKIDATTLEEKRLQEISDKAKEAIQQDLEEEYQHIIDVYSQTDSDNKQQDKMSEQLQEDLKQQQAKAQKELKEAQQALMKAQETWQDVQERKDEVSQEEYDMAQQEYERAKQQHENAGKKYITIYERWKKSKQ